VVCCSFIDKGVISRNASDGPRVRTSIDVLMEGEGERNDRDGRSSNLSVGAHGVGGWRPDSIWGDMNGSVEGQG
jgi:hypothetical protein